MGEGNKDASELREVHHLLTQGKGEEAQLLLAQIANESPAQDKELTYLHVWCAVVQDNWELVIQRTRDIPVLLPQEDWENLLVNGSIRRRRPVYLLILGEMARNLGYPEEATEHLQHCLALLSERRMNIPAIRLLAHYSLGRLSLQMNQSAQALIQYTTAKDLCGPEQTQQALFVAILIGLCETHARLDQFELALSLGKQALSLLLANPAAGCQEQLLLLLSRICLSLQDGASALSYAQEARQVANEKNDRASVANTLLLLAEIQQKMGQAQEAQTTCRQAIELVALTQDQALHGAALFLCGKIAEAQWRQQPEQENLAQEALRNYEQARELFEKLRDLPALARVSKQLAQLLEDRGEPGLALAHWKNAYTLVRQRA